MASKRNDRDEFIRCVSLAYEVTDETIPLDLTLRANEGIQHDRTELRKIAFGMVLRELLDCES